MLRKSPCHIVNVRQMLVCVISVLLVSPADSYCRALLPPAPAFLRLSLADCLGGWWQWWLGVTMRKSCVGSKGVGGVSTLGSLHGGRGPLAQRLWLLSVPTGTVLLW